jgi:hypothetical protein
MTPEEAVPLLARWIAELQCDLAQARERIRELDERAYLAADIRWWMERHTPAEVQAMARDLEAVA